MRLRAFIIVSGILTACGGDAAPRPGDGTPDAGVDAAPDSASPVEIVEIVDLPPLLGHQSVTHVRASDPAGIIRVELFVDNGRVGATEIAPFAVAWDASAFSEGVHRLRALAYTTDGRTGSAEADIQVDHTAPVVSFPAATATRDAPFTVTATDPAGVASIVVRHGDTTVATLTEAPFSFPWFGEACGAVEIHVIATDGLGNATDVTTTVDAVDTHDLDCDGAAALAFGGNDCDDTSRAFGPTAADPGNSLFDYNCDGIPGVDADHDGVPSVATGGSDCDDNDVNTHGPWGGWTGVPVDLGPTAPAGTFAALDASTADQALAFVGTDGALRVAIVARTPTGPIHAVPELVVARADTGADRHPDVFILSGSTFGAPAIGITYFVDASLMIATRLNGDDHWTTTEIDHGDASSRLRRAVLARDNFGGWHVAYEIGSETTPQLRYATDNSGTWTTELIPLSSDETLARDPRLAIRFSQPMITFRTDRRLWLLDKSFGAPSRSLLSSDLSSVGPYNSHYEGSDGTATFVIKGDTQDDMWIAIAGSGGRFIRNSSFDRITQVTAPNTRTVIQRTSRTDASSSIVALDGFDRVVQTLLPGGEIVSSPRSLVRAATLLLRAADQSLWLAAGLNAVAEANDPTGGADLNCDGRP